MCSLYLDSKASHTDSLVPVFSICSLLHGRLNDDVVIFGLPVNIDYTQFSDLTKPKKEHDSGGGGDASSNITSNFTREPEITSVGSVTPVQDFITLLKTKQESSTLSE